MRCGHAAAARRRSAAPIVALAGLCWLVAIVGDSARAETAEDKAASASIGLGNRGWSASETKGAEAGRDVEVSFRAGGASDYVARGMTEAAGGPAAGAAFEGRFNSVYVGASVVTVKLPTEPAAELTVAGGVRRTIADIDFDLGVTYFAYPNEKRPGETDGINYWEAAIRGDKSLGESFRVAAGYAFAPNISNTGAWSQYVAAGLGYIVPSRLLPEKLGVVFTAAAGYSWFGHQAPQLDGFRLPAYFNWQAGVTFIREALNLDLRYYGSSLSKENCFVHTGDPNARAGGRVDLLTNPDGLVSNWCSARVVARVWFAF